MLGGDRDSDTVLPKAHNQNIAIDPKAKVARLTLCATTYQLKLRNAAPVRAASSPATYRKQRNNKPL
ncbi:hypothetical protein KCP75_08530 [Salmonella enterica subsp. enterica]|nr:hypothetical protein KCP75_08530 [Salmonella enterica subsp. enterica]